MRISDWSSDVCSSDLAASALCRPADRFLGDAADDRGPSAAGDGHDPLRPRRYCLRGARPDRPLRRALSRLSPPRAGTDPRPEVRPVAGGEAIMNQPVMTQPAMTQLAMNHLGCPAGRLAWCDTAPERTSGPTIMLLDRKSTRLNSSH